MIKYFCSSCGVELPLPPEPFKIQYLEKIYCPDLCRDCQEKIMDIAYKAERKNLYDDKE